MTTTSARHVSGRKLRLSHVGLSCFDLPRLEDFYTRVTLDDAEILHRTEEMCRATGDCQPYEEWREKTAARIADDQARLR